MKGFKIVVSGKGGRAGQKELTPKESEALLGAKIGQAIQGSTIGFEGYEFELCGGSDTSGFPMRKGLHTAGVVPLLVSGGTGYRPKTKGIKDRKRMRGERITEDISQINLKVTKEGSKKFDEYFPKAEAPAEEKKEKA